MLLCLYSLLLVLILLYALTSGDFSLKEHVILFSVLNLTSNDTLFVFVVEFYNES